VTGQSSQILRSKKEVGQEVGGFSGKKCSQQTVKRSSAIGRFSEVMKKAQFLSIKLRNWAF